jgi:RNA polymerase sigma-70 factor (ECF subfamily)
MAMVTLLKEGSERERLTATNYLYKRFYESLKWYFTKHLAFSMKDNATNADDLAITTLTKAFDNIAVYDQSQGAFTTWLYRIGINLMIDHVRRTKSKVRSVFQEPLQHFGDEDAIDREAVSHYLDPLQSLEKRERKEIVQAIIENELNKSEALLVRLRYMQELKYEEIAQRTGKPLGTIKGELNRLKNKFLKFAA